MTLTQLTRRACVASLGLLLCTLSLAGEPDAAGLIAESWGKFRLGTNHETEVVAVRIERSGQAPELKTLTRYSRYHAQGDKVVVKFSEPAADRGMGLLIARESLVNASGSQMWLRMPSWPQARRIASDRETRYFGGTDFSFEDNRQLMGEAVSDFNYRLLKSDAQGTHIEATPKQTASSGYSKRIISLNTRRVVVQIQYFDTDGSPLKTQRHEALVVEPNGRWRANAIVVDNPKEGSRTRFDISKRDLSSAIADRVFTASFLSE